MTKTAQDGPEEAAKDAALPGNHGQFGENNATEDYKRLEDLDLGDLGPAPSTPPKDGTVASKP